MAIKDNLTELMERKMDRSEFLRATALTLAGVIGIARFITAFNHAPSVKQGYGSSAYGGSAEDRTAHLKKSTL